MACPPIVTGEGFLVQTLAHLDCQAQTLGSFGFQSLAEHGSPALAILTASLTLFIAIYGVRLLTGQGKEPQDIVNAVLKVGIVLTLATSWPAWRTIAYDTVFHGPAEIATAILPSSLVDPRGSFPQRLQAIDTAMAALTAAGTGRQTGQLIDQGGPSGFRAVALEDETGLGWSRSIFLASTIGSVATLRIAGGLLLAIAPLVAGLLLFNFSHGLFSGWCRGLAWTALGSLGLTVLLAIQTAVMEPWLQDTLNRRDLGYATPSAPTELLALVLAFGIATVGLLLLLGKVAFQNVGLAFRPGQTQSENIFAGQQPVTRPISVPAISVHSRAAAISEQIALSVRREDSPGQADFARQTGTRSLTASSAGFVNQASPGQAPLGSRFRRPARSEMQSQRQRDSRG